MTYRITNVLHMVQIKRSWQDKKVIHSFLANVSKFIRHAIYVLLDNSNEICLCLIGVCSRSNDSSISMHSVNPSGKDGNLVLVVCQSRHAMNYVPSILTNLAITESDELFLSLK